jgi:para-aminobenzoyl-glutamate transporter family
MENQKQGFVSRALGTVERVGNKLPDPAVLFFYLILVVWLFSAIFSAMDVSVQDFKNETISVKNLLTGEAFAEFFSKMVGIFTGFHPLGVVLVAMLGVGVADYSGYINSGLRIMLSVTPKSMLTPMVILVGVVSHTAADAGYVLVIPLAGIIFHAAGRHPLAGIAAAFAGVSGGFSANFIPSSIDPLLQGFTQTAAQIVDENIVLNPLNNWYFTSASTLLIVLLGWLITDKIVEPRLKNTKIDDVEVDDNSNSMGKVNANESKAFWVSTGIMLLLLVGLFVWAYPMDSTLRNKDGDLTGPGSPLMAAIVTVIFIVFVIPGIIYGFLSGTYKTSADVIKSMSKAMSSMSYYMVLAFFCAIFIYAFNESKMGAVLAIKGASLIEAMKLGPGLSIVLVILLTAFVNLFIGSASAKWGLLAPILVPMFMALGISPDFTQAAYRVGDSVSNIITPLMVYFPLIVIFCQKYVKNTGIGSLTALMLPYSIVFTIAWTIFLLLYWQFGLPLGLEASYEYVPK